MPRLRIALVVVLVALRLFAVGVVLGKPGAYESGTAYRADAQRYFTIASHEGVPHRDFEVEFPPVTLGYLELVGAESVATTMHRLAWTAVVFDLLGALAVLYGWGRRAATAYLVLGAPFLSLPFVYFRVDFLAVALAAWGVALARRRRETAGGAVLAVATFAKFWPLALVPVFLVRRQTRALVTYCAVAAAIGLGWLAWAGTDGPEQVLTFRGAHGWQIESLVGSVSRAITGSAVAKESGALRTGSAPGWAGLLLGLVLVVLVVGIWHRAARTTGRSEHGVGVLDGVAPLAAVVVFLLCSPLLSPQYLVWVLPFAAVSWACGQRGVAAMAGAAVAATMVLVRTYEALWEGTVGAHAVLLARNGILLATLGVAWVAVRRAPKSNVAEPSALDAPVAAGAVARVAPVAG